MGKVLVTEATKRRDDAFRIEEPVRLRCMTRSTKLRHPTLEELGSIPGWREQRGGVAMAKIMGKELGEEVEVSYSLLAIGPILFIGVPEELLSELGSMLKWCSPFKRTYIMYEATGGLGYIAHPNAYRWGGYEAISALLSPACVRPLINHILDSAEELYASR